MNSIKSYATALLTVFSNLGPEAAKQSWWWRFSYRVTLLLDKLLIRRKRNRPWCCKLLCPRKAEWDIYDVAAGSDPYDVTQACTRHIGALLGDSGLYTLEQV